MEIKTLWKDKNSYASLWDDSHGISHLETCINKDKGVDWMMDKVFPIIQDIGDLVDKEFFKEILEKLVQLSNCYTIRITAGEELIIAVEDEDDIYIYDITINQKSLSKISYFDPETDEDIEIEFHQMGQKEQMRHIDESLKELEELWN